MILQELKRHKPFWQEIWSTGRLTEWMSRLAMGSIAGREIPGEENNIDHQEHGLEYQNHAMIVGPSRSRSK